MFPEHQNLDLVKICSNINDVWEDGGVFEKSVKQRSKKKLLLISQLTMALKWRSSKHLKKQKGILKLKILKKICLLKICRIQIF